MIAWSTNHICEKVRDVGNIPSGCCEIFYVMGPKESGNFTSWCFSEIFRLTKSIPWCVHGENKMVVCIPSVSRQRSNPGRSMLTPYNMKSAEVAYWVKTETGEKSWYWKQKSIKLSQSQEEFWLHTHEIWNLYFFDEVDQYVGGRLAMCCSLLFVRPSVQTWGVEKKTLKNWENETLSWNW